MLGVSASLPPPRKQHALRISVIDGMLFAVMLGASESYLGALAVELGHDAPALALLSSVPLLAGALSQLLSATLARWIGTRKRLVVCGAAGQALSHLGFVWVAQSEVQSLAPLLTIKPLAWASGAVIAPAWSDWMASLTKRFARERYFALRSAGVYTALLLSFIGAGAWLHHAASGERLSAFAQLFWVACGARALSATALFLQPDRTPELRARAPGFVRFADALREGQWRTALYLAALMFGVYVSVPFFTPYMLHELALDYQRFVALTAVSILAKACVFPFCHRMADRIGLRALLVVSGTGIALLPALWAELPRFELLIFVELLGGAVWAGLEFASFQLLLGSAKDAHRVEFLAVAGAISGLAQLLGSLLGAHLMSGLAFAYGEVFWISTCLRGASLLVLVLALPRLGLRSALVSLVTRLTSVRPNAGAVQRPLVIDDDADDA